MHTTSSATTTTSLMHLHSIHGLHIGGFLSSQLFSDTILPSVLDPQISYKGIKADHTDDLMLSNHLKQSRFNLIDYFKENYANIIPAPSLLPFTSIQSTPIVMHELRVLMHKQLYSQVCYLWLRASSESTQCIESCLNALRQS